MSIKKVISTRFIDDEEGFEYTFEPIEDTITITKTKEGFSVRYLVQDDDIVNPPDEMGDNNLFLVNYHRDFDVRNDEIITKDDLVNWYRQDFDDYDDGIFPHDKEYWIFPLACLIHSGVWLKLGSGGFASDGGGWDTSHVGAIFVSKEEWKDKDDAHKAALSLVETWNQYLSGDVYGCVRETFDKDKNSIDHDSCWGFYGYEYAKEELKTF